METAEVGRKKKATPEPNRQPVAINIKGDPSWKEWLEEGAKHCQVSVAALVSIAVAKYLKAEGFAKKPPDRLP